MIDIDEIMMLLDWNRSHAEQAKGIHMAQNVKCLKAFFQPIGANYGKNVWENCAVIICNRSDDELVPYIRDMLLWLQDLNWPGAELIQNRLIQFQDIHMLTLWINSIVPELSKLKKDCWLFFISGILENTDLKKSIDPAVLEILNSYAVR